MEEIVTTKKVRKFTIMNKLLFFLTLKFQATPHFLHSRFVFLLLRGTLPSSFLGLFLWLVVHVHVGFHCCHLSRNLVPIISCHSFSWFIALSFVLELHLIILMHFLVCFVDNGNIFLALNLFSFASDPCDRHLFLPLWDTMCVFMLLMKFTIVFFV